MANTISPNMALIIPGVGTEDGPAYATDVNNSLTILDAHSHVAGSGVLITSAAININTSLPMNNNLLTGIKALTLTAQPTAPSNNSLYDFGGNLHFVDGSGNDIPITAGGVVNATSSGISSGSATASFVAGTLVVNASALTPANIQAASYLMGNNVSSSNYLTLQPPNAMAANYALTFPTLPAQTNVMTLDATGNMGSITYDAVGQNMTSVGANAIEASRTTTVGGTVGIGGVALSNTSASYINSGGSIAITNFSVTLTTSGRPVFVGIIPDSINPAGYIETFVAYARIDFTLDGTDVSNVQFGGISPYAQQIPPNSASTILFPSAGAHTFAATGVFVSGTGNFSVIDCRLIAYEL